MTSKSRRGMSLLELMAAITILGIVALVIVPRFTGGTDLAKKNACDVNRGNIEVQCQLWYRANGTWPARRPPRHWSGRKLLPRRAANLPF